MAGVKRTLSESERKKLQKLTGLDSLKQTKALSPIQKGVKFVKVKEEDEKPTTKEEIEQSANEYFKSLIKEENLDSTGNQGNGLYYVERKEEPMVTARVLKPEPHDMDDEKTLENMPHSEDEEEIKPSIPERPEAPEIESKPQTLAELFDFLDGINKQHEGKTDKDYYKDLIPEVKESLGLEKLEKPEIDEAEIRKQVEESLGLQFERDKENAKADTERKTESLENQKVETIKKAEANEMEINEIYDNAKLQSSNESLKRGLARSSIAVLSINGLEREKAESLSNLATSLSASLEGIENNIASLQNELAVSLENLDIEYAIEVNEKIKEEAEKLYKKQKEVIEFNNNVEKLEADYQSKRENLLKEARKREEELAEEYKGIATKTKEKDIKDSVLEYFSSIPKDQAIKELAGDSRFADYLGASFFDVYYEIMRR